MKARPLSSFSRTVSASSRFDSDFAGRRLPCAEWRVGVALGSSASNDGCCMLELTQQYSPRFTEYSPIRGV